MGHVRMQAFIGTSGYAYKEWKGHFYPDDLPATKMLEYYATQFRTVEINNTFYRMPKSSVVLQWASQVPREFAFVLKASRRITHLKRLKDVGSELDYFLSTASTLKKRLGPILFQLPPNFKCDQTRLAEFLRLLPKRFRAALEFRHASWHTDEVRADLQARSMATVVADAETTEPDIVPTADWGYLRLRQEAYDDDALRRWAERIHAAGWSEVYVFFKHEDEGTGPKLAARFAEILGA